LYNKVSEVFQPKSN